jgi:hypothetical protein
VTFSPCGGEIVGAWTYNAIDCIDIPDMSARFGGTCTGVTVSPAADVTATVTFNADGTWSTNETRNTVTTIDVPQSCLPPEATCDSMANPTMTVTPIEGGCRLVVAQNETEAKAGTYVVSGNTATLTNSADATDVDTGNFCVQGDTMVVEVIDETGARGIITHTRVP